MQRTRNVGAIGSKRAHDLEQPPIASRAESIAFDIGDIATRIIAISRVTEIPSRQVSRLEVQYVPSARTFVSTERHTDVSEEDLSERWNIGVGQARETLKRTTQKFVRSAGMPLARRYRADRIFHKQRLGGEWYTDTIDGRVTSIDSNRYAQVFANKTMFA